ncbi:MAG: phage major capsid protein [Pseudomonadota bacterium]
MTTPETKARGGTDVSDAQTVPQSAAAEVKTALTGLVQDLTTFQSSIRDQLQAQDEKLTMLDRKTALAGRPALSHAAADTDLQHKRAFSGYLRTGDDDALRGLELETKAYNTGDGSLVDPQTAETIKNVLESTASIRSISTVVNVEANSYDVLVDHGEMESNWVNESGSVAETATGTLERVSIPLHELSALPKISQRLLDDSAFDVEGWLAGRIAEKFAIAESIAFINGDGVDKPTGFLTHPQAADAPDLAWGTLGYIATGAAGDFNSAAPSDSIIELVYALGANYRANARFVMNSKTAGAVRKMKDSDGRFLWADGLAAAEPARLMGYPVLICEAMDDIADGNVAIAFGDFAAGYTVAERPDLRVLRDPFSAKPHVMFYATKRVGGDVCDFSAIKLLKFSTN